jgi:hypothetical protein
MCDMRANAAEEASAEEHAKFEMWHADGNAHCNALAELIPKGESASSG